jgi:hypothetical protein
LIAASGELIGTRQGDEAIRISSEARRLMAAMRKQFAPDAKPKPTDASSQSWSPLRSSLDEVTP